MALFDIFKRKKSGKTEKHEARFREKSKEDVRKKTTDKTEEKSSEVKEEKKQTASETYASNRASQMLVHPLITEKSARLAEHAAYTFHVVEDATKNEIKKAVEELYRVHVRKVTITRVKPKRRIHRGKEGIKPGFKKAVAMLHAGEKIEFV